MRNFCWLNNLADLHQKNQDLESGETSYIWEVGKNARSNERFYFSEAESLGEHRKTIIELECVNLLNQRNLQMWSDQLSIN